ncbi:hypothetical protein KSS87_018990 [Heliosperma pusillum]|nr:hypothetical protein KSS87_018990 [Heliosperma pusillum]
MLTGRESLRRLIGKRRRHLPNLPRILSSSPSPSSSNLLDCNGETMNIVSSAKSEKSIGEGSSIEKIDVINGSEVDEFVKCPVCDNQIRGDNRSLNSHIDLCLVRGTKRKLSQRTLLQFSFSSNSQNKIRASDTVSVGTDECQTDLDSESTQSDLQLVCVEHNGISLAITEGEMGDSHISTLSEPPFYLESTTPHNSEVSLDNGFNESGTNDVGDDPPLCRKLESSLDVAGVLSTLSEMALETYIVGRKFGDVSEVQSGESFSLVRDQDNIKDPNAIKVISPDPGNQRVLGYLPRDLARHLSPLIDNYQLTFEGVVTSSPKSSTEIVPVEIMCLTTSSCNEATSYDLYTLKSLCANVFHSINLGQKCPPSTTKYQQNFRFMVEEVLRSSAHLLTDAEKTFLGRLSPNLV